MYKKYWYREHEAPLKDVCKPHKEELNHNLKQLDSGGQIMVLQGNIKKAINNI